MKRILRVLPLLVACLVSGVSLAGQRRVDVESSPDGARVRTLRGELSPPSPEAPREIAVRFLAASAGLFKMQAGLADLRLAAASDSPGGRHFRFDQTYRGLPVFDVGAEVHVARDGRVYLAHNRGSIWPSPRPARAPTSSRPPCRIS